LDTGVALATPFFYAYLPDMKNNLLIVLTFLSLPALAQHQQLRRQIDSIAHAAKGRVGVAICLLEAMDTLTCQNHAQYVMHSVMKFPIAMAVLNEVDKGHLTLTQHIKELLSDMVSLSDNNACDILLKQIGGPKAVNDYMSSLQIAPISIQATEAQMAAAWPVQYTNWCEPYTQVQLLRLLYKGAALSKTSNDYLWQIMLATSTGPKRLKGQLPPGTQVAHKTGTSNTNDKGLTAATNDVGIIILPNGKHLAIAVFITDSTDDETTREAVIATIAKAAFREFL
jgi:beta-lactamase class A